MSNFVIYRNAKHSSFGSLGAANNEVERNIERPNADEALRHLNERPVGSGDLVADVKARIEAVQGDKPLRKDGVIAIEHIVTCSPEWYQQNPGKWKEFEKAAIANLEKEFGKENIVTLHIHNDETTPHIQAFTVPFVTKTNKKGKEVTTLAAKDLIGGREKLSQLQTSFAKAVEHLGLRRGVEKSQAKHQTLKEYYGKVDEAAKTRLTLNSIKAPQIGLINPEKLPDKGTFESGSSYKKRIVEAIQPDLAVFNQRVAQTIAQVKKEASTAAIKAVEADNRADKAIQKAEDHAYKVENLSIMSRADAKRYRELMPAVMQMVAGNSEPLQKWLEQNRNEVRHYGQDQGGLKR